MIARIIRTNEMVEVRQVKAGDAYFIDKDNNPYKVDELDFREIPRASGVPKVFGDDEQMNGFAAFMQSQNEQLRTDNKASYYRQLKGDVFLALIDNYSHRDLLVPDLPHLVDAAHEAVEKLKHLDDI